MRVFTRARYDMVFVGLAVALVIGVGGILAQRNSFAATQQATGPIVGISSKCLTGKDNQITSQSSAVIYDCNASTAQKWTVAADGSIKNQGLCLDVKASGTTVGTVVWIYTCNSTDAQKWTAKADGSLLNPHSGLCLDDKTSGLANNNPLQIYTCNGTAAQSWKLPTDITPPPPVTTQLTVDFNTKTHLLDTYSLGVTISTFNGDGGVANINKSAIWKANLQALGPMAWRIPLRYNNGNPGSAAKDGQTSGDAGTYIQNIKAIGGVPVVVVGGNQTATTYPDNNFSTTDAAGLVHYFNDNGGQHGGPVHAWVIGNEYTNPGNDPIGYQSHLAAWAAAMKTADPTITLSVPAIPDMQNISTTFSQAISSSAQYINYLSYHAYQGKSKGLGATSDYETIPNQIRSQYITSANFGTRVSQVQPGLEEFNWVSYYSGETEFYDWHNTVFAASLVGHSLAAGAHAYEYADSNSALGLMNDGSGKNGQPGGLYTKFPMYWGLGIWTGLNGTFRGLGSNTVKTSSTVANVEVFATDNGKIVVVNKDTTSHTVSLGVGGKPTSGTYTVWQTNHASPLSAPSKVTNAAAYSGSTIQLVIPAGTVDSVEL